MRKFLFLFFLLPTLLFGENIIVHAIPKCGTYFIKRTLETLTGEEELCLGKPAQEDFDANHNGYFFRFFSPYDLEVEDLIQENDYKLISMIRDPRDALLSLVVYMQRFEDQGPVRDFFVVADDFDRMTFDQKLSSVMTSRGAERNYLLYYKERIQWSLLSHVYCVKYENLVGSQGGGDDDVQRREVLSLCQFLSIPFDEESVSLLYRADTPYASVETNPTEMIEGKVFHHAQIGEWKKFFKPKHKKIIKKVFGQLLIDLGYEEDLNW